MSHQKLTMLSPKSLQVDFIPGGFGGLTQADICHALAGLDNLLTKIAYVCYIYTQDDFDERIGCPRAKSDQLQLLIELTRFLQSRCKINAAKAQKLAVCLLAVSKAGQSCLRCNGQKQYVNSSGKWQECGKCGGSGYHRQSQAELARIADVHHSTWQQSYSRDYSEALAQYNSLLRDIHVHVRARLANQVAL